MKRITTGYADLMEVAIISFFINLAYYETILYCALTVGSIKDEFIIFSVRYLVIVLIGWIIMVFIIGTDNLTLKLILSKLENRLNGFTDKLKDHIAFLFLFVALPVLVILPFVTRMDIMTDVIRLMSPSFYHLLYFVFLFAALRLLRHGISGAIKRLAKSTPYLDEAVSNILLSLKLSIYYFAFLLVVCWIIVRPYAIEDIGWLTWFCFVFSKDLILLALITIVLYIFLYKLKKHRCLSYAFHNLPGYLLFTLLCAFIAVLAVWAEFTPREGLVEWTIPRTEEQKMYRLIHVYGRDIGCLLVPIGSFLLWIAICFLDELKESKLKNNLIK